MIIAGAYGLTVALIPVHNLKELSISNVNIKKALSKCTGIWTKGGGVEIF